MLSQSGAVKFLLGEIFAKAWPIINRLTLSMILPKILMMLPEGCILARLKEISTKRRLASYGIHTPIG